MSEEAPFLVCVPVGVAHPDSIVEGSTRGWCVLCATEVWISPSGRALMDEINAQPHCWDCTMGIMATTTDVQVQPMSPTQREEIKQHLRRQ